MKTFRKILIYVLVFIAGAGVLFALERMTDALAFSSRKESAMPKTFNQMVAEALAEVPTIKSQEAHQTLQINPNTLVVDVRDSVDIATTGIILGAINNTLGTLTYKADHEVPPEWRDLNFADFGRPIITTPETGEMAELGGKLLKDMGYIIAHILEGGTVAWKNAGYSTDMP